MSKTIRTSRFRPAEFCNVAGRKLVVEAVPAAMTGNAGAILLGAVEKRVGIVKELAGLAKDDRQQTKVKHFPFNILMQRVCQIATGNEDGNDCDWGRLDPAIKIALGRDPVLGMNGASQETTCIFEAKQDEEALKRLENLFLNNFIKRKRKRPRVIWLDIDGSPIETYGAQEGAIYRGGKKYGYQMYFPLFVFSGKWLLAVTLRNGLASESKTVVAQLEQCVKVLRAKWAGIRVKVRLDAAFGSPELYNWCRRNGVAYLVGMKSTSVLKLYSRTAVSEAEEKFKEQFGDPRFIGKDGDTAAKEEHERIRKIKDKGERMRQEEELNRRRVRVFTEFSHKAESWSRWERIIVRVDYTDKGPEIRYVLSSSRKGRPEDLYGHDYCKRGLMEQFIGRLKLIGKRLSAQTFETNQFRLILYGVAYQLLLHAQETVPTRFRASDPSTLQRDLLNLPAVFRETKTKIVMQISEHHPHCKAFLAACRMLRAS